MRTTAAFSTAIMKDIIYGLCIESVRQNLPKILYPVKIALRNEGDIKTVLDRQKLKALVAIRSTLENIVMIEEVI